MGLMFVKGEVGFQKGLHEFGELSDIDFVGRAVEVWLGWLFSGGQGFLACKLRHDELFGIFVTKGRVINGA